MAKIVLLILYVIVKWWRKCYQVKLDLVSGCFFSIKIKVISMMLLMKKDMSIRKDNFSQLSIRKNNLLLLFSSMSLSRAKNPLSMFLCIMLPGQEKRLAYPGGSTLSKLPFFLNSSTIFCRKLKVIKLNLKVKFIK